MPNIVHEKKIIKILLYELSRRNNFTIKNFEYPEELKPIQQNPIDALCFTDKGNYVIEHTTLQTYEKQITEDKKIEKLIEELKDNIESNLNIKGNFTLLISTGVLANIKIKNIMDKLQNWVFLTAPSLKEGNVSEHYKCENIEIIGFEICLYKRPYYTTKFHIKRFVPDDIRICLNKSVIIRLNAKMEKLNEWKIKKNAISIIVLESFDFPLADLQSICNAVAENILDMVGKPDIVFILETYENSTNVQILRNEENFKYYKKNSFGYLQYDLD